jgi:hypothetical protein
MAGYSGTPLPKKLGIREGDRLLLLEAPDEFGALLGVLPASVSVSSRLTGKGQFEVILLFMTRLSELQRRFRALIPRLNPSGGFWVAWPKKASGMPTDITEDRVREVALPAGLVDNKVCAIDETWSGLRCVIRRENRSS